MITNKKILFYIVIGWIIYQVIEYYFLPYFVAALLWVLFSLFFLIISIFQIIKLILELKSLSSLRIYKSVVFSLLLYVTFTRSFYPLLEKMDWIILYDKRVEIVNSVKKGQLNPNVNWNGTLCQLPFEFPVVSNGGNDILIFRRNNNLSVQFWTLRNFFSAPSTSFYYTNDEESIKMLEEKIISDPNNFWKLKDNWYRIYEND